MTEVSTNSRSNTLASSALIVSRTKTKLSGTRTHSICDVIPGRAPRLQASMQLFTRLQPTLALPTSVDIAVKNSHYHLIGTLGPNI
jgi:hypothetical protein